MSGFGLTFAGIILSLISFPESSEIREQLNDVVPDQVLADLAIWYIPICIVAFGSALSLVAGYSLTRDEHEDNAANPDTKVWKGE